MSAKKAGGGATGLPLTDGLVSLPRPQLADYCRAAAEYITAASVVTPSQAKIAQVRLSNALGVITLADLRERLGQPLPAAYAGEREVGGGLRTVQADVSEMTARNGLTLAVEIKPVHLAVGRAIWNRFGDIRTFAVNIHLKFPFAVIGGIMTLPTEERLVSGNDLNWKPTTTLIAGRPIDSPGLVTVARRRKLPTSWKALRSSPSTIGPARLIQVSRRPARACGGMSSSTRWRRPMTLASSSSDNRRPGHLGDAVWGGLWPGRDPHRHGANRRSRQLAADSSTMTLRSRAVAIF